MIEEKNERNEMGGVRRLSLKIFLLDEIIFTNFISIDKYLKNLPKLLF